ncbi:TetR/AcrR family transcriptional regulator [Sphingomonas jeddahensis]|uniref:Fatty acid metabolism regulator protein n=1 Tax=Sphingomonas jeddahensis TaxID=1915074 RepID=A0A1V2EXX0_9SPHN|nr:TetR/AcrR family transcriptional regulator [Sphingomonas jeddahensis]ONF97450.1 Fatty acid metabolism regulator protein [Sphingomonas jeddahensis]
MIQAAREAFAANGFHGTGVAQIAHASGIAVGQIYRDFANKEAIVAAIVERDLEDFLSEQGLCAAGAAGDPEAVRAWIGNFVACKEPESGGRLVAEIMAEASRNDRIAEIVRNVNERMSQELSSALRLLVPASVSPARFECVAEMIQTIAAGVFQRRITEQDQPSSEAIRSLMGCINAAIDGLQREEQPA